MKQKLDRSFLLPILIGLVEIAWWSGAPSEAQTTTRMSVFSDGTEGNAYSHYPAVSAGCRYVAFRSAADNLVPNDFNGVGDVFLRTIDLIFNNGFESGDVSAWTSTVP